MEAKIQHLWLILENASILLVFNSFKPFKAPMILLETAENIIRLKFPEFKLNKIIGLIFWAVISKKFCVKSNPSTTFGNQKCNGAAPLFKINLQTITDDKISLE